MKPAQQTMFLLALIVAVPIAAYVGVPVLHPAPKTATPFAGGTSYPPSKLKFQGQTLNEQFRGSPLITNVQVVDIDGSPGNEVLCCDALKNQISLLRYGTSPSEEVLIRDVAAPAHATAVDIDNDQDVDILVSVLGNIFPDDNVIGRVELFEKTEEGYKRHVILKNVRRVADVQPADFDGDGDIDLAVAVFGYARGAVLWLENKGDFQFLEHELHNAPGTIHVPIADYDGDGDPDIAAIVTQDEEELWAFENLGDGDFQKRRLWFTFNHDLGSAGLVQADLDSDGDADLILPAGDNLEDLDAYPQPYHGCYWFENKGGWSFDFHRISDLGGTYAADAGDLDQDGDLDVTLVSMTNNWRRTDTASIVWLENDGQQNFTTWQIDNAPIHLVTVAIGDIDGDERPDIVAGGLNFRKPYQRVGRVHAWLNRGTSE